MIYISRPHVSIPFPNSQFYCFFFTYLSNEPIIIGGYVTYKRFSLLYWIIVNVDCTVSVLSGAHLQHRSHLSHLVMVFWRKSSSQTDSVPSLQVPLGEQLWWLRPPSRTLRMFTNRSYRTFIYLRPNPHTLIISMQYCHALGANETYPSHAVSVAYQEPSTHRFSGSAISILINS